MASIILRAARGYAELNLPACPINGKSPAYENGHGWADATSDLTTLDSLFLHRRHSGVGIATGEAAGVWVLDVDGPEGMASIRRLMDTHGLLPHGPVSSTGNGWHLWFRWYDRAADLRNSVKRLPGLDVRTTGGGVVVPPSHHASGRTYVWHRSPYDVDFPTAPSWLFDALVPVQEATPSVQASPVAVPDRYAEGALRSAEAVIATAPGGSQRAILYRESLSIGARIVGAGLCDFDVAVDRLAAAGVRMINTKRQKWTPDAVRRVVVDGLAAGMGRVSNAS